MESVTMDKLTDLQISETESHDNVRWWYNWKFG